MTMDSLDVGKLHPSMLKQIVLSHLGVTDPRVLLGPSIGEDASVIDLGQEALVIHSDPITGAVENLGWLAVNVCANDIATRGVRPLWMLTVILLPENATKAQLKNLTSQIDEAARKLGVAVVGGHCEVTATINRPIIIATAIGMTKNRRFVKTSGAQPRDTLIVTKGAAIEGTAILASELPSSLKGKMDRKTLERDKHFIKMTSVVEDALTAVEADGVHAMHDVTEGGIAAGLQEIAWASNVGLVAYEEKIPISSETEAICRLLAIDPLKTIGSGALLISCEPRSAKNLVAALKRKGVRAAIIGMITKDRDSAYIIRRDGTKLDLSKPVKEQLWKVLKKEE